MQNFNESSKWSIKKRQSDAGGWCQRRMLSYFVCKYEHTWSLSMPLLTPLRRRGSTDPMLKEANYSQYLPHSREARSSRGQACETFLQPAAAAGPPSLTVLPCPPFSSFIHPPPAPHLPLLPSVPFSILIFLLFVLHILISLSNIHSVICFHSEGGVHLFSHSSLIFWKEGGIYWLVWIKHGSESTANLTALLGCNNVFHLGRGLI